MSVTIRFSLVMVFGVGRKPVKKADTSVNTTIVICITTVSTARHLFHSLPLDTLRRSTVTMIIKKTFVAIIPSAPPVDWPSLYTSL